MYCIFRTIMGKKEARKFDKFEILLNYKLSLGVMLKFSCLG